MRDRSVSAASVEYSVGEAVLVEHANLHASPGEVVAILGPNGAGKTTLLSLLAGDLHPKSGSVRYGDEDIGSFTIEERAIARAVFSQRTPLDIPFTARAVVELGRFPHRHDGSLSPSDDAAFVDSAMNMTDTTHLSHRVYATLSGGERTRVALARVLAQDTPIVLLDEPTTALDVYHQQRVMRILRSAADDGRTIVAVLHDLNAAARYADRIVVMADGAVRAAGTPGDVLDGDLLTEVYGQPMVVVDHPLRSGRIVLVDDRQR